MKFNCFGLCFSKRDKNQDTIEKECDPNHHPHLLRSLVPVPVPLSLTKFHDLPEYDLAGTFDFKTVRVFDGDTFYAAIDVGGVIYRVNCRILKIDTPEIPKSHTDAWSGKKAYLARDRLVELITNCKVIDYSTIFKDSTGIELPSFSTHELQKKIDEENTLVLPKSIVLKGKDKYGRYLVDVKLKGEDGRYDVDVGEVLLKDGLAKPFMST